ncbi:hypothetical protein ABZ366_11780 [Streptomyces sp. NPDC005904]|uniref:hypothetical protein n=1 Tax=Streptomyces sp. NPDC005904 TaxID=3154570 RepID=UPI00340E5CCA
MLNSHTPQDDPAVPSPVPLPCGPCLHQLITTDVTAPHPCAEGTALGLDGGLLYPLPKGPCPCRCQQQEESPAAEAGRAAAHRVLRRDTP